MSDGLNALSLLLKEQYEQYIHHALSSGPLFQHDPEEQERRKRERQKAIDELAQRWSAVRAAVMLDPLLVSIVELHSPTSGEYGWGECDGCRCEVSGYEYGMEKWPCSTFLLVEESL